MSDDRFDWEPSDFGPEYDDFDSEFSPDLPTITVILACDGSRVNENEVKFIDISEDMQGRDVLHFECPKCGFLHISLRYA